MKKAPRGLSTELIHHAYEPPAGFEAAMPGVHKASTVIFANVAAMRARDWKQKIGYTYGLHGTPTTFTLEERIATLEGGLQSLLMPSGLAAIALVDTALLKTGDELLIPSNAYNPGRELARQELAAWGITHRLYDPMDARALAEMVTPATKLVWIEPPGSITMEFPDLGALVAAARSTGALVALDNTWGAGIALNGFEAGADVVIQALTKYPSGGADVMMGSVTTRDEALHLKLKLSHMRLGWGVGVDDVQLVLRSLPTIELRYHAQDASARQVARWCAQRPEIARVLHPALPGSPGHEHWARHCTAAAGLFAVVFDARHAREQVDAFVDALRVFRIGFSWAGPVSLAVPYDLAAVRGTNPWGGYLVRFSIGLEHADDLIADIEQALGALA
jgi:cystathionine beta-lyase